jgi:hypothetical protein
MGDLELGDLNGVLALTSQADLSLASSNNLRNNNITTTLGGRWETGSLCPPQARIEE